MSKLILKLFISATAILCLNACLVIPGGKVPKLNESHFDDFQPNLSINFQIIDKALEHFRVICPHVVIPVRLVLVKAGNGNPDFSGKG